MFTCSNVHTCIINALFSHTINFCRISIPPVWVLYFTDCFFKVPLPKTQSALIGRSIQARADITHCVSTSALAFCFFAWGHWLDICDITTTTPLKALNTLNRLYILLDLILRFFDTLTLFIKHEDLFWIKKNKNKHGNLTVRHKNVENVQNVDSEISNLKRAKRWVTIRWTFIRCQEICF